MEYKALPILSKEIGEDRVVKSIFSVFGNVDDGGDRIWPGAFAKTIQERSSRIKVLWQHDSSQPPIGVPVSLEEIGRSDLPDDLKDQAPDASGALVASVKYLDTPRGNEVLSGIRDGAITENSIGYDAVKWDIEEDRDAKWGTIRNLREVRLWDVSPVVWGMQSLTTNVKSLDDPRLVSLARLVELLLAPDAMKVGRVLSSASIAKIQAALQTLQELLTAAEPPTSSDDEDGKALTVASVLMRLSIAEREFAQAGIGL
jgi:HK97 family phage prohead protease